jgi:gliding motility-associated-like protein
VQFSKPLILLSLLILTLAFPAKGQFGFSADNTDGCTPMKVKYTFTCVVDTFSSFYWDFGNGDISNLRDPDTVVYTNQGTFTPALVFNDRINQIIVKPNYITVHHTVQANFTYYDTISYEEYVFKNIEPLDTGVNYTFSWDIEGFPALTGPQQQVTFPAADTFTVALTVSDEFGCTSTISQEVIVLEEFSVQNVFTPTNHDGINDLFEISTNAGLPLKLRIYTRAGILVHEMEGTLVTWNGKTASGLELKPGVYFYIIEALKGDPNKRYSKTGFLHMY